MVIQSSSFSPILVSLTPYSHRCFSAFGEQRVRKVYLYLTHQCDMLHSSPVSLARTFTLTCKRNPETWLSADSTLFSSSSLLVRHGFQWRYQISSNINSSNCSSNCSHNDGLTFALKNFRKPGKKTSPN